MAWYKCTNNSSGGGNSLVPEGKVLFLAWTEEFKDESSFAEGLSCSVGQAKSGVHFFLNPNTTIRTIVARATNSYPYTTFKVSTIKNGVITVVAGGSMNTTEQTVDITSYLGDIDALMISFDRNNFNTDNTSTVLLRMY